MQPDQHLLDAEQTDALIDAFLDIADEHGIDEALYFLALVSPPPIQRATQAIRSELSQCKKDDVARTDLPATAHATHQLQEQITDDLQDALD